MKDSKSPVEYCFVLNLNWKAMNSDYRRDRLDGGSHMESCFRGIPKLAGDELGLQTGHTGSSESHGK